MRMRKIAALAVCLLLTAFTSCTPDGFVSQTSGDDNAKGDQMVITELENGKIKVKVKASSRCETKADPRLPFPNVFSDKEYEAVLYSNRDLTPPAVIEYTKRGGGSYIYSNNPESLAKEDVGQALLRNEGLNGECFFTYEHSNRTGAPFFLGYQLRNESDAPITVRVLNIGNQVRGEWLGQREWSDFYGLKFDLPEDYWLEDGKTVNPIYIGGDYIDYTPQVYAGEVFEVPVGGYVWVLGGTSGDLAYGSLSGKTADQVILNGKCANGAVRFVIEGGSATGTFWCYTEPWQCDPKKPQQGYVVNRNGVNYAAQYKGIDAGTVGLAEAEICWIFGDSTRSGRLPVKYKVRRDPDYLSVTEPYAKFNMQEFDIRSNSWLTSLNPNDNPTAVGTDMISFSCVTEDGKDVVIDTEGNDGAGKKSNIGNWMMENQANYIFANAGSRDRTLRIYSRNTGVLAVIVRSEAGEVLGQKLLLQPYSFGSESEIFADADRSLLMQKDGRYWFKVADGRPYCDVWDERSLVWELTVPAGEVARISIDDLILANSCGGVNHWIEID